MPSLLASLRRDACSISIGREPPRPAKSGSETEKFLAEPEVQELLGETGNLIAKSLKKLDDLAAAGATASAGGGTAAKPSVNFSAAEYGDFLNALLTHPTAMFITDIKRQQAASAEPAISSSLGFAAHGGMVASLGPDTARLRADFARLLKKAKKEHVELALRRIKIRGETWYRIKADPGDITNETTFGFYGNYFVLGVGHGSIEGILDRWKRPMPDWLAKATAKTPVPRRTGIIYLDAKLLRDVLPLSPDNEAALKFAGLDNVAARDFHERDSTSTA